MLEEDIKEALKIVKTNLPCYDHINKYSKIYQNTTENIKDYICLLDGNYKSALLPVASADHALEAVLSGITDITCFDINRLAKYFSEFKLGAIKGLTRNEYIRLMYRDVLSKDIFDFFKNNLDDNIRIFWDELYKCFDEKTIYNNLFRYLWFNNRPCYENRYTFYEECAKRFTNYLEESNFKLVQERLMNIKITYIDANFLDLPNILNRKYDLINFTNIYDYIGSSSFSYRDIKFIKAINSLTSCLNDNGKMLIAYLYKCHIEDIKHYSKKSLLYAFF